MPDFDSNRLFEEGYPGLRIAALMGSASDYQKVIEEYMPVIAGQMNIRFAARMKVKYDHMRNDDLEADEEYQLHLSTVTGLLGGLLSGSVLVAAWSAFEQGVAVACGYVQKKEGVPFGMDDLRESDFCGKLHKYLHALTRQEYRLPHSLGGIQALRNLYAHHNGNLQHLSDTKRARIENIIKGGNGITLYDKHQVVLSPEFLRSSLQKLDECLGSLLRFIESRYPYDEQPRTDGG